MPVITIHCRDLLPDDRCRVLAGDVRSLCLDLMGAAPDAIQVQLVQGVQMLDGQPVYVEAQYRARPDRVGDAVQQFVAGLDQACQHAFGVAPRIRAFAIDSATLTALR